MTTDAQVHATTGETGEALTLALLRNSPDCVKVLNTSGRIGFMSENGRCAMEIDDFKAIAGKTWWDLWPEANRADLAAAFGRSVSGEDVTYEGECPTAKGTPKRWTVRMTPIADDAGVVRSVLAVSREV